MVQGIGGVTLREKYRTQIGRGGGGGVPRLRLLQFGWRPKSSQTFGGVYIMIGKGLKDLIG